jgi:16S rRNA (guanine527-N7)-methyltransferase
VSDEQQTKMLQYLELLTRWNQAFNLTAIREPAQMVWLHLVDSLVITPFIHGVRIIDVGTGAGLPGIPLALTMPDKQFVLLDSNSKKTRFLTQAKLELGLKNIEIIHSRCEDLQPGTTIQGSNERFDTIVSRAFSSIPVMLAKTQHLLADNGVFLAMKGTYPAAEIQDIPQEFQVSGTHKLAIHGLDADRHVVCIARK